MRTLIPFLDKVLVRVDPKTPPPVTYEEGVVLSKGSEVSSKVRVGDKVLFDKWCGVELGEEKEREKFVLLSEREIMALIEEK